MPAIVQIAEVTLSMPVSNTWPEPGAIGTSTRDKPLESMEPEHPLDSEDTVEDEEVELHTEEEQNMEDVYHIFNRTECSSDIDSALGSESEDDF
ncbi:unnamed protein product [Porites lobata]|uniref:Uncharacterized protein n=1 Tax=Porites lobata TaxID=104759 RepID=A0ABN8P4D3_9CNID|nr:unnamed protein product [Porites lobata]